MAESLASVSSTVGYIGLGSAGYPMAANLVRSGLKLLVRDANQENVKRFQAEFPGTKVAADPQAFQDASVEVVVTMLPDGNIVRQVLLGDEGIAKYLHRGTVFLGSSKSKCRDPLRKDLMRC